MFGSRGPPVGGTATCTSSASPAGSSAGASTTWRDRRRPEQNRHRRADGWQGSTVRAILDNPRYTGYAIFGRSARQEMRFDPDDVGAGHVTRFRRAAPEKIVRSRVPAHPSIVSVQTFTETAGKRPCVGTRPGND